MITVRHATVQDREGWQRLYHGYAQFYRMPMDERILDTVWSWVLDDARPFYCLLATRADGRPVGLMHFREMPSPLRGTLIGFLDDLFVDPDARGLGVVEALYAQLGSEAKQHGWPFVRWITRENNYRARAVYDRLATRTDWVTYQLDV